MDGRTSVVKRERRVPLWAQCRRGVEIKPGKNIYSPARKKHPGIRLRFAEYLVRKIGGNRHLLW
jgi:hypothetical protein